MSKNHHVSLLFFFLSLVIHTFGIIYGDLSDCMYNFIQQTWHRIHSNPPFPMRRSLLVSFSLMRSMPLDDSEVLVWEEEMMNVNKH